MLKFTILVGGWVLALAMIFVTLAPIRFRPSVTPDPRYERFAAYVVLGGLLGISYSQSWAIVATALVTSIAVLEALQNLVPGRHGRTTDAIQKIAGAILGVAAGVYLDQAPP